jgi:uncharacterized protein
MVCYNQKLEAVFVIRQFVKMPDHSLFYNYLCRIYRAWGLKIAFRFFWNFWIHFPVSQRWIGFTDSLYQTNTGMHAPILIVRKKCFFKYISINLSFSQRVKLIEDHYRSIKRVFSSAALISMLEMRETEVALMSGKSGKNYRIYLTQCPELGSEGELSIILQESDTGLRLATLTFMITISNKGLGLVIGGLQGPNHSNAKSTIVEATRDLHGLRPKNAVLIGLLGICSTIRVEQIEAVCRANNPSKKRGTSFIADNDSFWLEISKRQNADGDFILPLKLIEKTIDQVPSKKKKTWLQRQDLKHEILRNTQHNISALLAQQFASTHQRMAQCEADTPSYNTLSGDRNLLEANISDAECRANINR